MRRPLASLHTTAVGADVGDGSGVGKAGAGGTVAVATYNGGVLVGESCGVAGATPHATRIADRAASPLAVFNQPPDLQAGRASGRRERAHPHCAEAVGFAP